MVFRASFRLRPDMFFLTLFLLSIRQILVVEMVRGASVVQNNVMFLDIWIAIFDIFVIRM